MANISKQNKIKDSIGTDRDLQKESRYDLQQMLIQLTEERVNEQFSDRHFDRENEKIKLIGGREITLKEIRDIKDTIAKTLQGYEVTYRSEYYKEINRLNGWIKPDSELHQKPPIVGRYTNEIIYGRFSIDVLPVLQHLNPYVGMGFRMHKHFQWLTEDGKKQLDIYIEDAIQVMKICSSWYEFRIKHARKFGLPFQLNLMEKDAESIL